MDVEQDKILTKAIDAINQARDQARTTLSDVHSALDSRFVNLAENLSATDRPNGRLVDTAEKYQSAFRRCVVDARDSIEDLLSCTRLELFDERWRGRGGVPVPVVLGPVSTSNPLVDRGEIRAKLEPIRHLLPDAIVAWDYDGTIASMLPNNTPWDTMGLPYTTSYLHELGLRVRCSAIITGRSADQVVKVAHLSAVPGLVVIGGNGLSRWDSGGGYSSPPVHPAIPEALALAEAAAVRIGLAHPGVYHEDKTHAVALHARAADQAGAQQMIVKAGRQIADRFGLELLEGQGYIEVRPPGIDKGTALNRLVKETGAQAVIFGGDAFNDVPAFAELRRLTAENGLPGIAVFSDIPGADESLRSMADLVVPGEQGIHAVMREIIDMTPIRTAE